MARYIDADALKEQLEDFSKWCRDGRKQGVDFVLDCVLPNIATADVAPRSEVTREVLAKVDDLAWRHKMRGHVSMDKFHDDIEELKQKYTEDQT